MRTWPHDGHISLVPIAFKERPRLGPAVSNYHLDAPLLPAFHPVFCVQKKDRTLTPFGSESRRAQLALDRPCREATVFHRYPVTSPYPPVVQQGLDCRASVNGLGHEREPRNRSRHDFNSSAK